MLEPSSAGFVFGQRFYDRGLIETEIYSIAGIPARHEICGEVQKGVFERDRQARLTDQHYTSWDEPRRFSRNYEQVPSVDDLPGIGVIAFEFIKP